VYQQRTATFVVPNKELRHMIDIQFMTPFYEKILSTKCTVIGRTIIVESAATNKFTKNLNLHCLNKVAILEDTKQNKAYFESVVCGLFFLEGNAIY
jgi:hypothetical protein